MTRQSLLLATLLATTMQSALAEQVLRRGNGAEPHTLDPQIAEGVPESNILRDLFEGLVAEDAKAELVNGIAESWDISEDGKVYTFKLRQSQWSDGTPLTAHDFVYAWQRAVNPETGSHYAFLLYPVKNAENIASGKEKDVSTLGVKAIDDLTFEVTLENATPYFLSMIAHNTAYPVPKHVVEKHGKEWTRKENIVSNGPFTLTDWVPNSQLTAVKSSHYWDKDNVKLDKVIFIPSEDANSELKRYRADEIDYTNEIPNDQVKWIRENLGAEFKVGPYAGIYYYGFNNAHAPFKDNPKLREALSLAIDRQAIVEKVTGVGETAAYNIVPAGFNGYTPYIPAYAQEDAKARLERAKALYAEAGYSDKNPLKINILYNTSENHKKIAIAIAAMWKQNLGVEATMENKEWKVYLQDRREKVPTMHVFRAGWISDYQDPNTFLELFQANSEVNDISYNNPEFEAKLKAATTETDAAKRFELLHEAEAIVLNDYALMPIYHYVTKHLVKPYVKGFEPNVMDHNRSKYMSIEK
ncbi:MAG: peptide ABC transporter substrate-binding protein [Cardiobacteriaceae bacterium]|nr:peptide ABC transporter substrate-binding protein [Cardiobacteriaceae bacterium]